MFFDIDPTDDWKHSEIIYWIDMIKRYLITTADERSWKFDRPVLFLGEWCRRYERKHIWENMDAVVAEPYNFHYDEKEPDMVFVQQLSIQLLNEVMLALNEFHQVNHSVRFWQIVLGHWLRRYVMMMFNRYSTVEAVIKNYLIDGTTIIDVDNFCLATQSSLDFIWACNDDLWNHILYGRILKYFSDMPLNLVSGGTSIVPSTILTTNTPFHKVFFHQVVSRFFPKFARKTDALIINSYLPRLEEVKLSLRLRQFPQFWRTPPLQKIEFDQKLRQNFQINLKGYNGFELFVRQQLSDILPICYLEGFRQLLRQASHLPWPSSPKFIYTSNNFDTDEIFKVWTGFQVEKGTPYFVGQHGNNYGASQESLHYPETLTCDKFFSWGWSNGNAKNIPAFMFKRAAADLFKSSSTGGLLLMELYLPHRLGPSDVDYRHTIYQAQQFEFVGALPKAIQQKLIVRFHSAWRRTHWADEQRWKDRYPSVCVELGIERIERLINRSRLVVHSYDSTGVLETLASNVPTICFWFGGLDHLLPRAQVFYEMLRRVHIIVDTPEQAAKLITVHWNNLEAWWANPELQLARKAFCNEFARIEKKGAQSLRRLLMEQVEHIL